MTDVHYGKKTKTFEARKLEQRLEKFAAKIADVKGLLGSGYEFDELVICMLGDMVDGTGIYPSQAHHQEDSSVLEQIRWFEEVLWRTVSTMGSAFPKVRVECIPGNHGRVSKFADESDNWDLVAYQGLQARARANPDDNIDVRYGGKQGLWMRQVPVRKHKFLLNHGHTVRSFQNIPWYGLFTRIGRWSTTKEYGGFDAFACGHYHTCGYHRLNEIQIFMNGTAVTSDAWATEGLGFESSNQWWFLGSSDKHTTTFQFPMNI